MIGKKKFDVNENAKVQLIFFFCWLRNAFSLMIVKISSMHRQMIVLKERQRKSLIYVFFSSFAVEHTNNFIRRARNKKSREEMKQMCRREGKKRFTERRIFASIPTSQHVHVVFSNKNLRGLFLFTHWHLIFSKTELYSYAWIYVEKRKKILLSLNIKKKLEPEKKKFALYIHRHDWNFFFFLRFWFSIPLPAFSHLINNIKWMSVVKKTCIHALPESLSLSLLT